MRLDTSARLLSVTSSWLTENDSPALASDSPRSRYDLIGPRPSTVLHTGSAMPILQIRAAAGGSVAREGPGPERSRLVGRAGIGPRAPTRTGKPSDLLEWDLFRWK